MNRGDIHWQTRHAASAREKRAPTSMQPDALDVVIAVGVGDGDIEGLRCVSSEAARHQGSDTVEHRPAAGLPHRTPPQADFAGCPVADEHGVPAQQPPSASTDFSAHAVPGDAVQPQLVSMHYAAVVGCQRCSDRVPGFTSWPAVLPVSAARARGGRLCAHVGTLLGVGSVPPRARWRLWTTHLDRGLCASERIRSMMGRSRD